MKNWEKLTVMHSVWVWVNYATLALLVFSIILLVIVIKKKSPEGVRG